MPKPDLSPQDLRELRRILARHAPQARVWAYGSRVTGQAHEGSDLDLVIHDPDGVALTSRLGELRDALSESDLPMLVDVHDWARIPDSFRRQIEQAHVVIQERE